MNKTFKYIVLLALACFVGKANAQELKTEVFSLLNLDYPGLEKVKALHQEGKDADAAKALLDYYRARTNVKTPDVNLKKVTIQTTKLKAKTVGAKAFAKIHKKAVVKVPKAKKKAYKKWLKKRGIGGKQKISTGDTGR